MPSVRELGKNTEIREYRSVLPVISLGHNPIPIAKTGIRAIPGLVRSPFQIEAWPRVEVGRKVYVQETQIQGMRNVLAAIKNSHRLVISVTLLQRAAAVEIERAPVIPAPPRTSRKVD